MKQNRLLVFCKGLCIGGTMLVPGVSGGSMAMILGIYDQLISSVSSFLKHKRKSLLFLGIFALGGILGMVLFANPLLHLIERYPNPTLCFFLGAVAGGIPMIVKKARIRKFSWDLILYIGLGILTVLLLSFIPQGWYQKEMNAGLVSSLLLVVAGIAAAVALVLPGISVSYLLLILGLYDEMIRAISECYFPFLIPLGIGLLLGIILTTKLLEKAMTIHPRPTYLMILGFMLGSVPELLPGIPHGWELVLCLLTAAAGFFAIRFLSQKE
jgi:putative membrane protein